jgi:hypothetical protein
MVTEQLLPEANEKEVKLTSGSSSTTLLHPVLESAPTKSELKQVYLKASILHYPIFYYSDIGY